MTEPWPGPIPEPWGDLYKNPPRPSRRELRRARSHRYRAPLERLVLGMARLGYQVKVGNWEGVDAWVDYCWPSWLNTWTGESDPNFIRWGEAFREEYPVESLRWLDGATTVRCWNDATGEWRGRAPGDWRFLDVDGYLRRAAESAAWLREREDAELEVRRAAEKAAAPPSA